MIRRGTTAATLAALLLAGCATPHVEPRVATIGAPTLGLGQQTPAIAADWWTAFGDPQLDRLVAAGLAANPSLDAALARVRLADSRIETERADLRPQVTGTAQVSGARIGEKFAPPPIGGDDVGLGIALANLRWNLDLFGRQRAVVRQAAAAADAARYDAAASRLMVSVSIAQTYVALTRAQRLIGVTDDFVTTRRQAIGYVQSRIRNQLASQFDLRAAQTLLAEAQQARTQAVAQRDVLVHALAALVGRGADYYPEITPPTLALDRAPRVPDALPADLLGRRPDLLAGQARIAAAVQQRKAAAAAFLPDVSISALAGLTAVGLGVVLFIAGRARRRSATPRH